MRSANVLDLTIMFEDGLATVFLVGELDFETSPQLSRTLDAILKNEPSLISIEVASLTFIDPTAIRMLVNFAERAKEQGCDVELRSPRPNDQ